MDELTTRVDPVRDLTVTEVAIYQALEGVAGAYLTTAEIARMAFDYPVPDAVGCSPLVRAHVANMRTKGVPIDSSYARGYRLSPGYQVDTRYRRRVQAHRYRCRDCGAELFVEGRDAPEGWRRVTKGWCCGPCMAACAERNAEAAASLAAWRERHRQELMTGRVLETLASGSRRAPAAGGESAVGSLPTSRDVPRLAVVRAAREARGEGQAARSA